MKVAPEQVTRAPFEFTAHPPERRSRGVIIAGGCCTTCCCCSCCLHALGGLLGAARTQPPADPNDQPGFAEGQALYWWIVCVGTVIAILVVGVTAGPWWGVAMLFFGIPLVQFVAAVIALLVIANRDMGRRDRAAAQDAVVRMTRRTLIGTGIGLLIMSPVLVPLLVVVLK